MASHENNQNAPDINTAYPGHITNFDPNEQTATVTLAIENLFVGLAEAYSLHENTVIHNVPVNFVQGGGWSLTHPIPDGTPCWVKFAQRGIEHWTEENASKAGLVGGLPHPSFGRTFNHNDCVCEVGYQPKPKAISSFQPDVMELRNADRSVRATLADGSITILAGSATILVNKDGLIEISSVSQIKAKAPQILLDGDTTVTKSLTVQGGMAVSGSKNGSTATFTGNFKMDGNMVQTGNLTLNGIVVNTHKHTNPEGGDVGPMK